MCNAFSFVVSRTGKVYWKFKMDSHNDIYEHFKIKDDRNKNCPCEITPENNNYIHPNKWVFCFDDGHPDWWKASHEKHSWEAHAKWLKKLNKVLKKIYVDKPIIHPFNVKPPKHIGAKHVKLLKQWDSVWKSVWKSVWNSVWDSVENSVWNSVWDSVENSVWKSVENSLWNSVSDSVSDSVWDSVKAYTGSFFKLKKWKYIKHKAWEYPFKPLVQLWEQGLVPSFDGEIWRLHVGKKAEILFEISREELEKMKV
jgi:hypothetical protein